MTAAPGANRVEGRKEKGKKPARLMLAGFHFPSLGRGGVARLGDPLREDLIPEHRPRNVILPRGQQRLRDSCVLAYGIAEVRS
jgi:hypothetical protein